MSEEFGSAHVQLAGRLDYGESVAWRGMWEYAHATRRGFELVHLL